MQRWRKCTHTYHVSQVTTTIFMMNFMLESGSLLHLGNCHLCNSTKKWMENSGCSVSCTMLLFCLRGLTPAEAHIERSCHLQVTLKGPGYWGFTRSPLRTVKFTWAFHHLCWLPKYFRDQIIGLRRKLSGRWGMHRLSDSDKWETSMWTLVFISLPQLSLYPLACNQVW